jgi:hypothetical protein
MIGPESEDVQSDSKEILKMTTTFGVNITKNGMNAPRTSDAKGNFRERYILLQKIEDHR